MQEDILYISDAYYFYVT